MVGHQTLHVLQLQITVLGSFYDIGGATGNYPNNISPTRGYKKICPPAGQSVSVFFNSFNIADDTFSYMMAMI